jgi:hypothetical protein
LPELHPRRISISAEDNFSVFLISVRHAVAG